MTRHRRPLRAIRTLCEAQLDQSKMMSEAGVIYIGGIACDRLAGHDGLHSLTGFGKWGSSWTRPNTAREVTA